MRLNKKIIAIACLLLVVTVFASMTLIQQPPAQRPPDPPVTNLKVLPKKLTYRQVDHIMDEWAAALGVRCNFCHAFNPQTRKSNFASDEKPEKEMARHMYKMMVAMNKKYFKAGDKDSLGMVKLTSINCYTCHNGKAHLELSAPPKRQFGPPPGGAPRPQSAPPAGGPPAGGPPAGGPPAGAPPAGTPPPAGK